MNTKPDITYPPADSRVPRLSGGFRATTHIKTMLRNKWPEAVPDNYDQSRLLFQSGLEPFDRLFPESGIPYGQLVEISGGPSSGKTSLLLHILAGLTRTMHVAYVDTGGMFFPGAADACGVDLSRLIIVNGADTIGGPFRQVTPPDGRQDLTKPFRDDALPIGGPIRLRWTVGTSRSTTPSGGPPFTVGSTPSSLHHTMRTTELMLQHKMVGCVVCDLVGQRDVLPIAWCHRLRTRTVRARGLVIFVTEHNSHIIPPSMISLRLEIERKDNVTVTVTVAKSRISPEGARAEVMFGGV